MGLHRSIQYFMLITSFAFMTQFAYNFFNQKKKKKEPKRETNEVIMFASEDITQKRSKFTKYVITPSMDRLLYYLDKPQHTLDICMYIITSTEIGNALSKLRYRGVKIRLIIDADMAFASGSIARKMEKSGIPVRWMKSTNLMHHKFCLIDSGYTEDPKIVPLVMLGSLNWTVQALNGNWEDVTVTSQKQLLQQYKEEFERLWVLFKPIVPHNI